MAFTQEAWDALMTKYPPGTPVGGVVTSRHPFGVFVRLDALPEVPTLMEIIHFRVRETDPGHTIEFPSDYPSIGARARSPHPRLVPPPQGRAAYPAQPPRLESQALVSRR